MSEKNIFYMKMFVAMAEIKVTGREPKIQGMDGLWEWSQMPWFILFQGFC